MHLLSSEEKTRLGTPDDKGNRKGLKEVLLKKEEHLVHNPHNPVLSQGGYHVLLADSPRNMIFFMK